jgi:hypothetical protein
VPPWGPGAVEDRERSPGPAQASNAPTSTTAMPSARR